MRKKILAGMLAALMAVSMLTGDDIDYIESTSKDLQH